jgi:hypothetical protein
MLLAHLVVKGRWVVDKSRDGNRDEEQQQQDKRAKTSKERKKEEGRQSR